MPNVSVWVRTQTQTVELYRTTEEIEKLQQLDPLAALRAKVIESGLLSEGDVESMESENEALLASDAEAAEKSADPDPESVSTFVMPPLGNVRRQPHLQRETNGKFAKPSTRRSMQSLSETSIHSYGDKMSRVRKKVAYFS